MVNNHRNHFWLKYLGVIILIFLWWIVKITVLKNNSYLPLPFETFRRMFSLIFSGDLLPDILYTLRQFGVGYGLALLIGIPVGLLLGFYLKVYQMFEIVLDFFRSIPVTALFPLFILFFGISDKTITAMVSVACVFVIILNSAYGVIYVNKTHLKVMKVMEANWLQTFREVIVYEALPFLFVGLRVSVSFGLIVEVVSEMFIGSKYGLGQRVYQAHETYLITDVYALTIFIGLLGYFFNKIILLSEKKIIHWKERQDGE